MNQRFQRMWAGVVLLHNHFTIGEMAKLHNVPVKTLRYYDEIGLLIPRVVGKNGYRYYSTEQFEQLDTIVYLKRLGLSLEEIRKHLTHLNVEDFLDMLRAKQKVTEQLMQELERIHSSVTHRIGTVEEAIRVKDIGTVLWKQLRERKIIRLNEDIYSSRELDLSLKKLLRAVKWISALFIGNVGITMEEKDLATGHFQRYNSVFVLLEADEQDGSEYAACLPAGEYACIFYRGSHQKAPAYYRILLDEIKIQGFQPAGEAVERTIIDQFITSNYALHLTEIQIPVVKNT